VAISRLEDEDLIKKTAFGVAGLELAVAVILLLDFVPNTPAMQFSEHLRWIPPLGISYHLAVDGISVLFVGVTAFLTALIVLYSWDAVRSQIKNEKRLIELESQALAQQTAKSTPAPTPGLVYQASMSRKAGSALPRKV
jgi:NADH:ubiquinone oxidoreductase subunit 4 (subunit M)